jgi:hypothetical protein
LHYQNIAERLSSRYEFGLDATEGVETMATKPMDAPAEVKIAETPEQPTFATVAEERLHRKQRLASAFRLFAKFGFSEGVAGHISPLAIRNCWTTSG